MSYVVRNDTQQNAEELLAALTGEKSDAILLFVAEAIIEICR